MFFTIATLYCWYYSTGSMVFLRILGNFLEQTYGRFLSSLVKIFQQWGETLGWSRSGFMIQDHSDHFYGASKVHEDYRDEIIAWFCPLIIIDQLCVEHNSKVWTHLFGQELIACYDMCSSTLSLKVLRNTLHGDEAVCQVVTDKRL